MYEARVEHDVQRVKSAWQRTSSLMALLANCHRDPKKRKPYTPADFDPFAEKPKSAPVGIDALRALLPLGHPERNKTSKPKLAPGPTPDFAVDIATRATEAITAPATDSPNPES